MIQQIRMARRPTGVPSSDDFAIASIDIGSLEPGQVRIDVKAISLDPYIRLRMAGRHLIGNLSPGDPISSEMIGDVTQSRDARFTPGMTVAGFAPWQAAAHLPGDALRQIDFGDLPASLALGVLGMPGLTAYAGVTRLMKPGPEDIVLVSAASGPVGATVGQLAKAAGARVIGIAGGPDKCRWVHDVAGFDACIDYKAAPVAEQLAALCPDGATAYFDNVGGELLRSIVRGLRPGGRVVLCGIIADYNDEDEAPGPTPLEIISARATVMGLVVYDHEDLRPAWEQLGAQMIRAGTLRYREDVTHGLDQAPEAFSRLMRGGNHGKMLVTL